MKIFISHSSKDDELVKKIETILGRFDVQFWVDHNELKDWDAFKTEIKTNIADSTLFLLVWSQNAKSSKYVKEELDLVNSPSYMNKIQKVAFNLDNSTLPDEYEDRLFRPIYENNLEDETEGVIFRNVAEAGLYFKIFKHIIRKHFRDYSSDPIIKNFKNFNAYKYYIRQRYFDKKSNKEGSNIVKYVLDLIDVKYSLIEEKNNELAKIKLNKEKLEGIRKADPTLSKKKSLTEKNLEEAISKKGLSQETEKNIQTALHLIYEINEIKKNLKNYDKENLIPVIGDYGSGKSAFCHYLLYELCHPESKFNPIFVPLRMFSQNSYDTDRNLVEDIYNFTSSEYGMKFSQEEFKNEISKGRIVFVLDGLDEMSDRLDDRIAKNNLTHIIKLAKKAPVVMTSRETYLSGELEKKLFESDEVVSVLDFSEDEVREYLKRYVEDEEERKQINRIVEEKQIEELAKKPLFLFVICKNHKYLKTQSRINESAILEALTEAWIEHDVEKSYHANSEKHRIKTDRSRISEVLAFREYAKPRKPIAKEEILEEVEKEFTNDNAELSAKESLDKYYADAVRATFLIKEGDDKYRFIARPVIEYFVAKRIIHDIKQNRIDSLLQHANVIKTQLTYDLIKGIADRYWAIKPHLLDKIKPNNPDYDVLKSNEDMGDKLFALTVKYRGANSDVGNLIKILYITGSLPPKCDLSDLTLGMSNLANADLREIIFSKSRMEGANLSGSDLSDANLFKTNLSYAHMIGSNLTNANFTKATLRGTHLLGANLSGTILNDARFVNADASRVIFEKDPQVEGIILVNDDDLGNKKKIESALNKLDSKLRKLIIEKNPKYRT